MQNQNSTIKQEIEEDPKKVAAAMVSRASQGDFVKKIVDKIKDSENILIAMSNNPSVDDLAAAIGLTMFLDGQSHHVTAIYSGQAPETLAFLRPDATFESDTASLQDFIIALNKDKADHLRYKLEGDFVKVFITPYKTIINENDLTFMRGDYNVDFVIAINVRSAGDLDEALTEHGRIMHDASVVDITAGEPGRFGEIEWSDPTASSVSEMVTKLVFEVQGQDTSLDADIATALLTGIVAATNRFSNKRTTPETLTLASKLMAVGADQQLISANVIDNVASQNVTPVMPGMPTDPTSMAVGHGNPASQLAQGMSEGTAGPAPAEVAIPGMAPIDLNSTVIKPLVPGVASEAPTSVEAPKATIAPLVNSKAMVTSAPTLQTSPMVGMSLTPPESAGDQPNLNYADLMQKALTEEPAVAQPAPMNPGSAIPPEPVVNETMSLPPNPAGGASSSVVAANSVNNVVAPVSTGLPPAPGVAPTLNSAPTVSNPIVSSPTMVLPGQPVVRQDVVLPPPPAPAVGNGMMPPSMPSGA